MAFFAEQRPVVDRDRDAAASPDLAIPPLGVRKQGPVYRPDVDSVMTNLVASEDVGPSDVGELGPSLEAAVDELFSASEDELLLGG